jgi:hypothetical protein
MDPKSIQATLLRLKILALMMSCEQLSRKYAAQAAGRA